MNKVPKYDTIAEANTELWRRINKLLINTEHYDFGYEREWDEEGNFIGDFLIVCRGDEFRITTMSPERFEAMNDIAKKDFLTFIMAYL